MVSFNSQFIIFNHRIYYHSPHIKKNVSMSHICIKFCNLRQKCPLYNVD